MNPRFQLKSPLSIGINGFGRIGRCVLRALSETTAFKEGQVKVGQINDLTDSKTLAHLLKYDSNHGVFAADVSSGDGFIEVNGVKIPVSAEPDPAKLEWGSKNVSLVMECTGRLKNKEQALAHQKAGAKKIIISAPMKDPDATIVVGINDQLFDPAKHEVVSNASCTTNCLAPVAKVLHDEFKILKGSMTTVHSYTNDQRILDLPHSDLRRARAAAVSMIPTTTGAAKAVGLVLPELNEKIDGCSIRVPTPNVSLVDFGCVVEKKASIESVNAAMKKASQGALKGILGYSEEELVSCDYRGRYESSVFDAPFTSVIDGDYIKILTWYDNEWGFSCRMIDLAFLMASKSF